MPQQQSSPADKSYGYHTNWIMNTESSSKYHIKLYWTTTTTKRYLQQSSPADKSYGYHTVLDEEQAAFADWINDTLSHDQVWELTVSKVNY